MRLLWEHFNNTSNLFSQIVFRFVVRLKMMTTTTTTSSSQRLQNPNFFTPNFLWLSEIRCFQNKWNVLSSWVLKYASESSDAKISSGDYKSTDFFFFSSSLDTYNPIFSCRSFFEFKGTFESFKCIPQRYLRPTSSSNWLTNQYMNLFEYYLMSKKCRTCQTERGDDGILSHLMDPMSKKTYSQPSFVVIS